MPEISKQEAMEYAGMDDIEMDELTCPFCGDKDFDLIGLKYHIQNYCDKFNEVEELT